MIAEHVNFDVGSTYDHVEFYIFFMNQKTFLRWKIKSILRQIRFVHPVQFAITKVQDNKLGIERGRLYEVS